jgi:cytoskeletal protein CcmA (bactofilin family)
MRTASRLFVRHTKWAPVALIMLASCLLLALGPGAHAAEKPAATQKKFMDRGEGGNVYLAGVGLRSPEAVTGDLYAAGCPISVDRPVAKDVVLAGCHIDVTGDVGDDLRAAGGQVTIAGKVGGEVMVAGGRIVLAPGSIIAGRAVLAGGEVTVEGNVAKDIKIYAGKVTIQGEVEGDALVMAQDIEMLSAPASRAT